MAQVDTTVTTTTTTATQTGTQLNVGTSTSFQDLGNFVTGVAMQPYIAPRIISFSAFNLRPNHRMHVFFDSVNVDQFVAPGVFPTTVTNSSDPNTVVKNGNWGDAIYTDDKGRVAGQFAVPAGVFRVGERMLQITNVDDLSLGNNAIYTTASATFTASNMTVTKQGLTQTTINPEFSYTTLTNQTVSTSQSSTVNVIPDTLTTIVDFVGEWVEPVAQALTIRTPDDGAGIFAPDIKLYFKQKSQIQQNGVTVYLCEILNGYPNGAAVLPFSTVHKEWADVNVSADGTTATTFTFEAPVFLANRQEYAFIVIPDAADPDYFLYTAKLGDIDLATGKQVFSQPVVGTAFYGATNKQWTALQNEYVKFELGRCNFLTSPGNAVFYNTNSEYLSVYNIGYVNATAGFLPGDYVFQAVNATPSTCNTSIKGMFTYYDTNKELVYVDNSSGNFDANTFIQIHRFANVGVSGSPNTTTLVGYANTGSLYNPRVNALGSQYATMIPPGTSITFAYTGITNTYVTDANESKINVGDTTEFRDYERVVASKTNEIAERSGEKSYKIEAKLSSDSKFLSPVIDLVTNQQLVIGNEVDPVSFKYDEFFNNTGDSKTKYISQIVTLADGQDSEDINLILSAVRCPGTDVQVWMKFSSGEDPEPITSKVWIPLYNQAYDSYSDPSNPYDFKEFTFRVPSFWGTIALSGTVTSANSSANVTGVGTAFDTELKEGWFLNMEANSTFQETTRRIVSITNSTHLTLDNPFNGNYTTNNYFLVPPPTAPYVSKRTEFALTGTVTVSTTNNSITGSGTNFTGELRPGSIIKVADDSQAIVSITNATYLTVGKPWSTSAAGADAYRVSPIGLTYQNEEGALFSTFKRFQIKIILQADDTARVPYLDDGRATALLL